MVINNEIVVDLEIRARPCATKGCEPRQAWKGATVSGYLVCRR